MGSQRARKPRSLAGTARMLHPLASQRKTFMVMASHRVPARCSSDSFPGVVVGLLATQAEWDEFGRKWSAAASHRFGRMADLQFSTPASEPPDRVERLLALFSEGGIAAAAYGYGQGSVDLDPEMKQPQRAVAPDPGVRCFQHCVTEAVRRCTELPEGESISLIMDWDDPLASAALWCLEDLKDLSPQVVSTRLGALGFESRPHFPPLQAATLLAREYVGQFQNLPAGARWREDNVRSRITVLDNSSRSA